MEAWALGLIITGSIIGLAIIIFALLFVFGPLRKKVFVKKGASMADDNESLPPPKAIDVQITVDDTPTPPPRNLPPVPPPRANNHPPVPLPRRLPPIPPLRRQPNLPPPPSNWQ